MECLAGKFVIKTKGHSDFGYCGIVLKSEVNPASYHILEVLSNGKVRNWLADYVEVLEENNGLFEQKNEEKKSEKSKKNIKESM